MDVHIDDTLDCKGLSCPMPIVKLAKKMAEDCKVSVRNIRREANDSLKRLEKNKELSEDEYHRATDEVQKATNEKIEGVEKIIEGKQKEILET